MLSPSDYDEWGHGWTWDAIGPYYDKVQLNIIPVVEKDRNPIAKDFVAAAQKAVNVPEVDNFNAKPFEDGVGFFSIAYHPEKNNQATMVIAVSRVACRVRTVSSWSNSARRRVSSVWVRPKIRISLAAAGSMASSSM